MSKFNEFIELQIYTEILPRDKSIMYFVHMRITPKYVEQFPNTILNKEFFTNPGAIKSNFIVAFSIYPVIKYHKCSSSLTIEYRSALEFFKKPKPEKSEEKEFLKGIGHFSLCFLLSNLIEQKILNEDELIYVQSETKHEFNQFPLNEYYKSIGFKDLCKNKGNFFFAPVKELLEICKTNPRFKFSKRRRSRKRRSRRRSRRRRSRRRRSLKKRKN